MNVAHKNVLITGGTGTVGKVLTYRLLSGIHGLPASILIFSRDEAKQYYFRQELNKLKTVDLERYKRSQNLIKWHLGDVRDYFSVFHVVQSADIVIHTAAMKQVPSCEYFPFEAVQTNIIGAENIVRAVKASDSKQRKIIGISTDKACCPASAMGMSKALQEKLFIAANFPQSHATFCCVRFGNLLISRGSVVPMFIDQIKNGGPVTVTSDQMTRYLLPVEQAVDAIFDAIRDGEMGEILVPKLSSAYLIDIAQILIAEKSIPIEITGIRPGEKLHENVISDEEWPRTYHNEKNYMIRPTLPELINMNKQVSYIQGPLYSNQNPLSYHELAKFLKKYHIFVEHPQFV